MNVTKCLPALTPSGAARVATMVGNRGFLYGVVQRQESSSSPTQPQWSAPDEPQWSAPPEQQAEEPAGFNKRVTVPESEQHDDLGRPPLPEELMPELREPDSPLWDLLEPSDEMKDLLGGGEGEGPNAAALNNQKIYSLIMMISSYMWFSQYYVMSPPARLAGASEAAKRAEAQLRAKVQQGEAVPREFLVFLVAEKALFKNPTVDAIAKVGFSMGSILGLNHIYNSVMKLVKRPDWGYPDVVKNSRLLTTLTLSYVSTIRTRMQENGTVGAPRTDAEGKRMYATAEDYWSDNAALGGVLTTGISAGFGFTEAIDFGSRGVGGELLGDSFQKFKLSTYKNLPRVLRRGARHGAKIIVGGLRPIIVEVTLTCALTSGVDNLGQANHLNPLVLAAEAMGILDDAIGAVVTGSTGALTVLDWGLNVDPGTLGMIRRTARLLYDPEMAASDIGKPSENFTNRMDREAVDELTQTRDEMLDEAAMIPERIVRTGESIYREVARAASEFWVSYTTSQRPPIPHQGVMPW